MSEPGPRQWLRSDLTAIGSEPDARFTFANERTFLAWNRTSLGTMVAGIGVIHLLDDGTVRNVGARVAGIGLLGVAALLSIVSFFHWRRCEIAMRKDEPLPHSWIMPLMAGMTGLAAVIAAISSF